MTLEYGNQEVIRFMYDKTDKKLVLTIKQEILEDGILKDHIFPSIVARRDDFDATLERLMPSAGQAKEKLETEAKAIYQERWEAEKQKRIDKAKEGQTPEEVPK